jgi:hypothetical protein
MKRQEAHYEAEIRDKIEPIVKKFLHTEVWRDDDHFGTYRVNVEMDTRWVEQCLVHGNSQKEISYITEMIGRQVGYELEPILKSRNFQRKGHGREG